MLTRPDLGRKLSEEAKEKILQECPKSPDVQLVVADGLRLYGHRSKCPGLYPRLRAGN